MKICKERKGRKIWKYEEKDWWEGKRNKNEEKMKRCKEIE